MTLGVDGTLIHDAATLSEATSDAGGTISSSSTARSLPRRLPTRAPTAPRSAIRWARRLPVSGNGTYTSREAGDPGRLLHLGRYLHRRRQQQPATHACGLADETLEVQKAAPTITTQVPPGPARLAPTVALTDTATLTGATANAGGSISFQLYGPFVSHPDGGLLRRGQGTRGAGGYDDAGVRECDLHLPAGRGDTAGFYTWIATYSGDAANKSATHACGQSNETVQVLPTQGTITTDAVDRVKLSSGTTTISDQATLAGVTTQPAATGTIEFKVYGPFPSQPAADSCVADKLVETVGSTTTVNGPGTYTSQNVQVKLAGYYVWKATYSGDANNEPATHACGQTEETTVVDKASPSISTQVAAGSVSLPSASLVDTAPHSATEPPTRRRPAPSPSACTARSMRPRTATAAPRGSSLRPRSSM